MWVRHSSHHYTSPRQGDHETCAGDGAVFSNATCRGVDSCSQVRTTTATTTGLPPITFLQALKLNCCERDCIIFYLSVTKQNTLPLSRALLVCVQVGAGLDTRRIHTCLFPFKNAAWPLLARVFLSVSSVLLSPLRTVLRYPPGWHCVALARLTHCPRSLSCVAQLCRGPRTAAP
jgi:hypothetical protein